jgi:hypothetical protein
MVVTRAVIRWSEKMGYLEQILGQGQAVDAESQCIDAFVKQASAEGIDLNQVPDTNIETAYADFREKFAAAMAGEETSDGLIEKAAASGASDEMLEQLALAKLSGEAMFEGWRESFEKHAQEEAAMEAPAEEGGGGEAPAEEEAAAILESAIEDAVGAVTEQAPDAAPEEIAEAAAEILPEVVEEKTSAYLMAKEAGPKLDRAGRWLLAHPKTTHGAAAGLGAGAAGTAGYLAGRRRKQKKASDILAEMLVNG